MHLFYSIAKIPVDVDIHAIEILGDGVEHVTWPATRRCSRSQYMVCVTWQVGVEHIADRVLRVFRESLVFSFGSFRSPALTQYIRFIVDLEIGHIVMIAHVKPVDSGKDMFPPFIPIGDGLRRIG